MARVKSVLLTTVPQWQQSLYVISSGKTRRTPCWYVFSKV